MSKFGDRLKEERVRLGLSQAAFAEKCAIHRNTQIKYESGERFPDLQYLESIEGIGVDVQFLYGGVRRDERPMYDLADYELKYGVLHALGFSDDDIKENTRSLMQIGENHLDNGGAFDEAQWLEKRTAFVLAMLSKSPTLAGKISAPGELDAALLASVLEKVDATLETAGRRMPPSKKAQAVAMLYRSFKALGKIDQKMIDEAVQLAAD